MYIMLSGWYQMQCICHTQIALDGRFLMLVLVVNNWLHVYTAMWHVSLGRYLIKWGHFETFSSIHWIQFEQYCRPIFRDKLIFWHLATYRHCNTIYWRCKFNYLTLLWQRSCWLKHFAETLILQIQPSSTIDSWQQYIRWAITANLRYHGNAQSDTPRAPSSLFYMMWGLWSIVATEITSINQFYYYN